MLRRQLDQSRGGAGQGGMGGPPQHAGPSQQPPPSIAPGNGLFNGIMTGGGQGGLAPPPPPPQDQQMGGPQHQMAQGPPGLPVPPPPPPPSQQGPPFQQPYPQGPVSNGIGSQPPPSTASPGPGRRGIGRPPAAVGPATPQINTPIPFPGATQSPQVSHPTPDHARMGPHPPPIGNALGDLDPDRLPAHSKKTGHEWFVIFNTNVPRMLDVDLVHTLQHESVVCCVRFSHDGKYVATGCNRSAQIFDVHTGEKLCVLQDDTVDITGDLYIRSVCFSPDGKYLATGAEDKMIRVFLQRPLACHIMYFILTRCIGVGYSDSTNP
jgi:general transcriptional corepressor TUP1